MTFKGIGEHESGRKKIRQLHHLSISNIHIHLIKKKEISSTQIRTRSNRTIKIVRVFGRCDLFFCATNFCASLRTQKFLHFAFKSLLSWESCSSFHNIYEYIKCHRIFLLASSSSHPQHYLSDAVKCFRAQIPQASNRKENYLRIQLQLKSS